MNMRRKWGTFSPGRGIPGRSYRKNRMSMKKEWIWMAQIAALLAAAAACLGMLLRRRRADP